MADTYTVTANVSRGVAPRSRADGAPVAVSFNWATGVNVTAGVKFGSAGDVLLLAKLPNGARVIDSNVAIKTLSATTHWRLVAFRPETVGNDGTLGTLTEIGNVTGSFTSAAAGAGIEIGGPRFFPKISLSDDAAVQFAVLGLVCGTGGSGSVSFECAGNIVYTTNGVTSST